MNSGSRIIDMFERDNRKDKVNDAFECCRLTLTLVSGQTVGNFYVTKHDPVAGILVGAENARLPALDGTVAGSLAYIITEHIVALRVVWI